MARHAPTVEDAGSRARFVGDFEDHAGNGLELIGHAPTVEGAGSRILTDEGCVDHDGKGSKLIRRAHTFGDSLPDSLSTIVGSFKSAVTRKINKIRLSPAKPVWQRNYYEHVIRKDESLDQIREYIVNNPINWATDPNNPGVFK